MAETSSSPPGAAAERDPAGGNVVPIGTRGRPGRGSSRANPSSATRSLALAGASAPPKKAAPKRPERQKAEPPKSEPRTVVPPKVEPVEVVPPKTAPPKAEPVEEPATPGPIPASPAASFAPGGIPVGELVSALMSGARQVLGDDWEARAAALVAQVRQRIGGSYEIDEFGLDPQIQEILLAALRPIAEKWFRVEVRGAENIPSEGGALIVANHSGTLPIDAAMTGLAVHDHAERNLRLLGADLVFSLPFVGELARKTGATLACNEDAERLLRAGHIAGVWPEGFKGIGKPYAERYKLQRFGRGGFVSAAMRTGVPIVPVSIVGAEEIYPLIGNIPSLARLLGVPYLPITPFFPLLGPLGMIPLPSKWIIEFGEPIRTDAYPEDAADDPMLVFNVTDQVRETIQQTLYSLLVDRGHPFF